MIPYVMEEYIVDWNIIPDKIPQWIVDRAEQWAHDGVFGVAKGRVPLRVEGGDRPKAVPEAEFKGHIEHSSVYELTLTSPDDDVYYLRATLQKVVSSAMFDVAYWKACVELTKAGLPHIHAIIYSKKKYLDATKLKKMFKHRYELKRVRDVIAFNNYILKEDGNPIMVEYCNKKGIPQIWEQEIIHKQEEPPQ